MRYVKRIFLVLLVVLLLAAGGFTIWAYTPLGPAPEALAALRSDAQVTIVTSPWLTFQPATGSPTTGLILYPGGRVDARSYAPAARALAERGYLAVIVPMPFNLAVFGSGRADAVIAAHPEIIHWVVGGHSLGGAMAAAYLYAKPGAAQGLVLWASYPADTNSLADRDLAVVSVYGTHDGLATTGKIDASRALLPDTARFVAIEGGNHAQFGAYGAQPGDGVATISPEEQRAVTVNATASLLTQMAAGSGQVAIIDQP